MTEKLYRIHWQELKTGKTGYSDTAFPKTEAEKMCKDLNIHNAGWRRHWIQADESQNRKPADAKK